MVHEQGGSVSLANREGEHVAVQMCCVFFYRESVMKYRSLEASYLNKLSTSEAISPTWQTAEQGVYSRQQRTRGAIP
jgi:hypothetical protein